MLGVVQLFGLGILPEEQPVEIGGLLSGTLVARLVPVFDRENLPSLSCIPVRARKALVTNIPIAGCSSCVDSPPNSR
jgi:hypothetical protein